MFGSINSYLVCLMNNKYSFPFLVSAGNAVYILIISSVSKIFHCVLCERGWEISAFLILCSEKLCFNFLILLQECWWSLFVIMHQISKVNFVTLFAIQWELSRTSPISNFHTRHVQCNFDECRDERANVNVSFRTTSMNFSRIVFLGPTMFVLNKEILWILN